MQKGVIADSLKQPRTRSAFAVTLAGTPKLVGIGELNIRDQRFRTGEISYILHPDYWGRGLGTEVAHQLLQVGFAQMGLHRIYATCDPRNVASAKVLQKVGMTYEARLRETILIRDGWRDSDLYSILEQEWKELRQTRVGQ